MWNFLPRTEPAFSLLYGKRPMQRVIVGSRGHQLEIPLNVVSEFSSKCDHSATYIGNKFVSLPWEDFIKVKTDAHNLIHANVKSALTGLDWYDHLRTLAQGKSAEVEVSAMNSWIQKGVQVKYPVAK